MPAAASGGGGGTTSWPLGIVDQAKAIAAAISAHGVPAQVFMGMYNNESGLGTNPNTGIGGPFQMTDPGTRRTYGYPPTATPNLAEFAKQADGAAHYLHDNYVGAPAPSHNWHFALQAYNAGLLGAERNAGNSYAYATKALAFRIPEQWKIALAGAAGAAGGLNLGPATPGGTVGAGGTGTLLNDSSGFQVGSPSNPDEDFWTALNRLAQDRYWYTFSDGETLYLADGPDLMKQEPALDVDRVANSGNISSLDLTYDNTAWTYTATHKRRRHIQRRSATANITSPVEAHLNYICAIDEVRAGDVVTLNNCGPGDGAWLAGNVRRSVFEVTSEINLVVALTPLTESGLNPAGVNLFNPSPSPSNMVINGPAKVQNMLSLATSLIGTPYSQANHAASFTQSIATIKRLGTDCSGFVSILLGPKGAGIINSPQTTQTLPGLGIIASGPGKWVTLYDRFTGAVSNEHVIIRIGGSWWECGGGRANNPTGGVSQLSAKEAAGELSGGGFVPLHPKGL